MKGVMAHGDGDGVAMDMLMSNWRMASVRRTSMPAKDYATHRRQILHAVARRANITVEAASFAVDELFELIRLEVSRGRVVSWPQIGAFGPYVRRVRGRKGESSSVRCTPRFSASRSFRLQVRGTCPPNASGAKKMRRHSINNAPSRGLPPSSPLAVTTREAIRASITRQLLAAREG
jgi:nucleoid DNA-binding protein